MAFQYALLSANLEPIQVKAYLVIVTLTNPATNFVVIVQCLSLYLANLFPNPDQGTTKEKPTQPIRGQLPNLFYFSTNKQDYNIFISVEHLCCLPKSKNQVPTPTFSLWSFKGNGRSYLYLRQHPYALIQIQASTYLNSKWQLEWLYNSHNHPVDHTPSALRCLFMPPLSPTWQVSDLMPSSNPLVAMQPAKRPFWWSKPKSHI